MSLVRVKNYFRNKRLGKGLGSMPFFAGDGSLSEATSGVAGVLTTSRLGERPSNSASGSEEGMK